MFLYRHANQAKHQEKFRFYSALDYSDEISKALKDAAVTHSDKGISSLAGHPVHFGAHWTHNKADATQCNADCNNGFTRLSRDLKLISPLCFVHGRSERYVDIDDLSII